MKCKVLCALFAVGLLVSGAAADIVVNFDPMHAYIDGVGGTTQVEIWANIPEVDAILGWGLDVVVTDPTIAAITAVTVNEPLFNAAPAYDGDGLAGLAFPNCVWGEHVTLAWVTFTGYALGTTPIATAVTPGDLTEGFALCGTGFANFMNANGYITVPEPATLALLAICGLALRRR